MDTNILKNIVKGVFVIIIVYTTFNYMLFDDSTQQLMENENVATFGLFSGKPKKMSVYEYELRKVATKYNIKPEYLFKVIYFESRGKHNAQNPKSSAYGLIQIMNETIKSKSFKRKDVRNMNRFEQVRLIVDPYFKPYNNQIKSLTDCYLTVFYPYAIGKSQSFVLGSQVSIKRAHKIASDNTGFDTNSDGILTKQEVTDYINRFPFPTNKKKLLNI